MFNHRVVPCNCCCCSFLGNMGGSTNPVAQLTLPSPTMCRDNKGGNQSEITKYLNKIVEHSNTSGKFHFVNYK